MEPLPKGANFIRAKTLWEIGLHLAGNPATRGAGGMMDVMAAVSVLFMLAWGWALPAFMLVWFALRKIRAETAAWR